MCHEVSHHIFGVSILAITGFFFIAIIPDGVFYNPPPFPTLKYIILFEGYHVEFDKLYNAATLDKLVCSQHISLPGSVGRAATLTRRPWLQIPFKP